MNQEAVLGGGLLTMDSFEETDGDTHLSVKETGPVGTLLHFFLFGGFFFFFKCFWVCLFVCLLFFPCVTTLAIIELTL